MMPEIKDRLTTRPSDRLTAPILRRVMWIGAALVWLPFAALAGVAAVVPAMDAPLNIQPVLMILAMIISTLSGATALLMRVDRELTASPEKPLPHPWIMSVSHMCGAWLAGVGAYLLSRQMNMEIAATLGMVLVGSFFSAKFLEAMFEMYMPRKLVPDDPNAT